jgi:hypothetical protein
MRMELPHKDVTNSDGAQGRSFMTTEAYCKRVDRVSSLEHLLEEVRTLMGTVVVGEQKEKMRSQSIFTINLNYVPGTPPEVLWWRNSAGHDDLAAAGIRERDFTEVHPDVKTRYPAIHQTLLHGSAVHARLHGTQFRGRCQLIGIAPGTCHLLHIDPHTPHRYHVPLETHPNCLWLFKKTTGEFSLLHMPADGTIWYLDPTSIYHSVVNASPVWRWHLIMTHGA